MHMPTSLALGLPLPRAENKFEVADNPHLMREMIFRPGKISLDTLLEHRLGQPEARKS
jgi:hypothetical protein